MYGYGFGYNVGKRTPSAVGVTHNASFVWHSEEYAMESSGFSASTINDNYSIIITSNISDYSTGTDKTLLSMWDNSGKQRGFILRVTDSGNIDFLSSSAGNGLDLRVTTTGTINNRWEQIGVSVDVSAANAAAAVTITLDGVVMATSTITDTGAGNYTIYASAKTLTMGGFYASGVLSRFPVGVINQCAVFNRAIPTSEMLSIWNNGEPLAYENINSCVISTDFDNATFSTDYTIPDPISGNDWTQTGTTAAQRTSNKNNFCNPYGNSYVLGEYPMDGSNFYQYDDQPSASFAFNTTDLTFTLTHSAGTDPDRNSCEVLSKGSYNIDGEVLWVRFNAYDWNASSLPMSHGGFSLIADKNDLTFALITHRVLNAPSLGNYRLVVADNGIQSDNEPGIAKGKDVFIEIDGTDVSFYYNNSGTLTQMWTTQSLDMGQSVRIKAHARDYNAYADPDTYETTGIKVYRTTPTDL